MGMVQGGVVPSHVLNVRGMEIEYLVNVLWILAGREVGQVADRYSHD
jgi:hypothetical protein